MSDTRYLADLVSEGLRADPERSDALTLQRAIARARNIACYVIGTPYADLQDRLMCAAVGVLTALVARGVTHLDSVRVAQATRDIIEAVSGEDVNV